MSLTVDLNSGTAGQSQGLLEILFNARHPGVAASLLIMMTSFTRIIIVLSFLRNALGTQQSPPNQVLIGISLFLTLFIMSPVLHQINTDAYEPYKTGVIDQKTALERASVPLKQFMLRQTKEKELVLFLTISGKKDDLKTADSQNLETLTNLSMEIIVPAFITSELKRAFIIGFLLFIPFLIIDMVVSSTLMSMGMVMLPPSMISCRSKS